MRRLAPPSNDNSMTEKLRAPCLHDVGQHLSLLLFYGPPRMIPQIAVTAANADGCGNSDYLARAARETRETHITELMHFVLRKTSAKCEQ